ncbi:hypothetical protein MAJ_05119, partial [Metarhizium majus ARSEF 297]
MSNQISVSEVGPVSDEDLKAHLTGFWVELKMKNWKEKGCIVLAYVGPEDAKDLWDTIQPIVRGAYGARSVHHDIVDEKCLFVVINAKNYDDGCTSAGNQIRQKTRAIDLKFLKEPAVLDAVLKSEKQWKEWFYV